MALRGLCRRQHRQYASCDLTCRLVITLDLIGRFGSLFGNEMAIRLGRRRLVQSAMFASVLLGGTIGVFDTYSYTVAAILMLVYGLIILLDNPLLPLALPVRLSPLGAAQPSPFIRRSAMQVALLAPDDGLDARLERRHIGHWLGHIFCRSRSIDARSDRILVDQASCPGGGQGRLATERERRT